MPSPPSTVRTPPPSTRGPPSVKSSPVRSNVMLVHVRHTARHLSPGDQAVLASRHKLVLVGNQVSVTDRRGGRHTYTWAMPTNAYLDGLRALEAKDAPPPYTPRAARPALSGHLLGFGGLEGPASLRFFDMAAYARGNRFGGA